MARGGSSVGRGAPRTISVIRRNTPTRNTTKQVGRPATSMGPWRNTGKSSFPHR